MTANIEAALGACACVRQAFLIVAQKSDYEVALSGQRIVA